MTRPKRIINNIYFPYPEDNYSFSKPLYAHDINNFLKQQTNNFFLGCYAADEVPWTKLTRLWTKMKPFALVMNFDTSTQVGSHYTALANLHHHTTNDTCCSKLFYYDSLALTDEGLTSFNKILQKNKRLIWSNVPNKTPHQDNKSSACGYYMLWFILTLYHKRPTFQQLNQLCQQMDREQNKANNNQFIVDEIMSMVTT